MSTANTLNFRIPSCIDAPALLDIYAPYVTDTAISFEYDVPSLQEFEARIINTLKKYPYIIAELDGKIVGYAYASSFHVRAAYNHSAEATIYLRQDMRGQGFGRALYLLLEDLLRAQGILNVCACIAYTPREGDPHLTNTSRAFHEHLGYRFVGQFYQCGYKFGMWYDMIWMEKHLAPHADVPPELRSFDDIRAEFGL